MKLGRTAFDHKLKDGMVHHMPSGSGFHTPNGMSLRPVGDNMVGILNAFQGDTRVYQLQGGILLPKGLIVFHEHTDHCSLQTMVPIQLESSTII
jgi:hypothetical protein